MTESAPAAPPASPAPLPDLLRTDDVAERFGCCTRTVRRWCAAGHLVPVRIGRSVFFRSDDIRRLIATDMTSAIVSRSTMRRRGGDDQASGGQCVSKDSLICAGDFQND